MRFWSRGAVALAFAMVGSSSAMAEGDVAAGKKVFKKCAACHFVNKKKNKVGPWLVGIIGRKAGVVEKYRYSKSLIKKAEEGLVWNDENLDKYLEAPKKFIKRGKMAFIGLRDPQDRKDIIAYLKEATKEK